MSLSKISIIIPAKNEAAALQGLLPRLREVLPEAELILVDDGSTDNTGEIARSLGARVIRHQVSKGNGAAIKTGVRNARGDILVCMDADGQHRPEDVPRLLARLDEGYDMVVGARMVGGQAGAHRALANRIFNGFSSWMVGERIHDLTSGFRAIKAPIFKSFLYLLPNRFSYPTTITMSLFRAGYSVAYEAVEMPPRIGRSHLRPLTDGFRFLLIILKIGTLFSPLKLFLPISGFFLATGLMLYGYTYWASHRFTNMGALLLITAVLTFLMGIVSEQVAALHYKDSEPENGGFRSDSEG